MKNITSSHLTKLAQKAGIQKKTYTIRELNQEIKKAKKNLRQIRTKHQEERANFLQQLSEEYAYQGNRSAQQILQTLIEQEHIKKKPSQHTTCTRKMPQFFPPSFNYPIRT